MDYEKKYNEALAIAKETYETQPVYRALLEKMFPELRESEDERIRKELINQFSLISEMWFRNIFNGLFTKEQILAYLERQKEQKPLPPANSGARYYFDEWIKRQPTPKYWDAFLAGIDFNKKEQGPIHFLGIPAGDIAPAEEDGPFDEDEFLDGELSAFLQNYDKEYDDDAAVSDVARHFYEIGKKQKEQKPESCDCSRDEESYTNGIHHVLMNPEAYGLIKQKPAEWRDTDMNEARNNLISVCRDWERGEKTTLLPVVAVRARYFLEHLTEPKPAEWKEEDEGMLNCIIATLCEESHGGRESNGKMVTWLENRLKSLRPVSKESLQPHWKHRNTKEIEP